MVAWMIGAGLAILIASAVIKVAPYYVEFNSVKGLMKSIASEPGIKNADKRHASSAAMVNQNPYASCQSLIGLQPPMSHHDSLFRAQ